ncbi:hypothetical protein ACX80L_10005 [Arthrobacter sp. MDT1-48-3]
MHIDDRTPVSMPLGLRDDWLNPTLPDGFEVQQALEEIPEPHLLPGVVGATAGTRATTDRT